MTDLEHQLVNYIEDAHAVEQHMLFALDQMISTTIDKARADNAGKNARDGYVVEQLEIACYELLERVATIAGDEATAAVARRNGSDEEAMAAKIAASWDKVARETLQQEGVLAS